MTKTEFVAVATAGELQPGQMKRFLAGGKRLLLVNADDKYYAIDEMCSHEDYSLAYGCISAGRIKCSLHGSYFDLETGAALDDPATDPIAIYPVKIAAGQIWVDTSSG